MDGIDLASTVGFSPAEFERRRGAVRAAMEREGVEVLLAFGNRGNHHAVQYLSGYQVSGEAVLVLPLEGEPVLLVHFFNHVPTARRASIVADVRPLGDDAVASCAAVLRELGPRRSIAVCGPCGFQRHTALGTALGGRRVADFEPAMRRLRLVKSEAEIAMAREGARLSDLAIDVLREEARPGMTEFELVGLVEAAYVPKGGQTHIHYIGVTSMREPSLCVPSQLPSARRVEAGDVIVVEISAQRHGCYGQVLRTFAVASEPTPDYVRLHSVAEDAFGSICGVIRAGVGSEAVLDAAESIDRAGYSIYDDLVHCAVGGVYAPYMRTRQTQRAGAEAFTFEKNMLIVVQPNVITRDERAGVQYGEMLVVTDAGVESLHRAPRGFLRCA